MTFRTMAWLAVAALGAGIRATPAVAQAVVVQYLEVRTGPANPPARSTLENTDEVPVLQLRLDAIYGNITVETLNVYLGGAGVAAGITQIDLWIDDNNDGYSSGDTHIATGTWVADHFEVFMPKGMPESVIVEGVPERWLVTVSLGASAVAGSTYRAIVYDDPAGITSFSVHDGAFNTRETVFVPSGTTTIASSLLTVSDLATDVVSVVPGGVSADQFVMITPSIDADGTGFSQIEDQMGPSGPGGNWRLFRYDETTGQYNEYGQPGFPYPSMDQRLGWWFISRRGGPLSFTGTSTTLSALASLGLPVGWIQVGNPYNGPLPLSMLSVGGANPLNSTGNVLTSRVVYRYEGGRYVAESAAMRPATGYWLNVYGATFVTYTIPPNALKPGDSVSQERELYAGEASPPAPPSLGGGGGGSGGGACFAALAGGIAGAAVLAGLGAAGLAMLLRRRTR